MKIRVKCPYCNKKILVRTYTESRKRAKKEKAEIKIIFQCVGKCELIHD